MEILKTKSGTTIITMWGADIRPTNPALTRITLKSRPGVVRVYVGKNFRGRIF